MERLVSIYEKVYQQFPYLGTLAFLDTETTGLGNDAKVIEIGAIVISFDGIDVGFNTFETLINPEMILDKKITEITGITDNDLKDAPGVEKYGEFVEWLNKHQPKKCIAHNAQFDKRMLVNNFYRTDNQYDFPEWNCTMEMSKRFLRNVKNNQLKTIAEYYQFVNLNAHRALADAEVCAYVYAKMLLGEY